MAYKVIKRYLDQSKYSLKAPYSMKPKFVVVHNTANDASADSEVRYMQSNGNATSFHVAVDDKEAIIGIPYNRNAWACGDGANGNGNRNGVSVEICYSKSGGQRYKDAEANAIEFVAKLLIELGLDGNDVYYHQDMNGKYCPHRILAEGRGEAVKKQVAKRYAELKAPAKTPAKEPTTTTQSGTLYKVFDSKGKQLGAFSSKTNADALKAKHAGSKVVKYVNGKKVVATAKKTDLRYVNVDKLNFRTGAGNNYPVKETLKKNTLVTIVDEKDGWLKTKSGLWAYGKYLTKKK